MRAVEVHDNLQEAAYSKTLLIYSLFKYLSFFIWVLYGK